MTLNCTLKNASRYKFCIMYVLPHEKKISLVTTKRTLGVEGRGQKSPMIEDHCFKYSVYLLFFLSNHFISHSAGVFVSHSKLLSYKEKHLLIFLLVGTTFLSSPFLIRNDFHFKMSFGFPW